MEITSENISNESAIIPTLKIPAIKILPSQMKAIANMVMGEYFSPPIIQQDIVQVLESSGEFIWVIQTDATMVFCRSNFSSPQHRKYAEQWLEAMVYSPSTRAVALGCVELNEIREITQNEAIAEFRTWKN